MRMPVGMVGAFLAAGPTDVGAEHERHADQRGVRCRPTQRQDRGGPADLGAVEIEADAVPQPLDRGFGKAGIGAGHASRAAIEAGLGGPQQRLVHRSRDVGMGGDHVTQGHGWLPSGSARTGQPAGACVVPGRPRREATSSPTAGRLARDDPAAVY